MAKLYERLLYRLPSFTRQHFNRLGGTALVLGASSLSYSFSQDSNALERALAFSAQRRAPSASGGPSTLAASSNRDSTAPSSDGESKDQANLLFLLGNGKDTLTTLSVENKIRQVFFSPESTPAIIDANGTISLVSEIDGRSELVPLPFFGPRGGRYAKHACWTARGMLVHTQDEKMFWLTQSSDSDVVTFKMTPAEAPKNVTIKKMVGGADHVVVLSTDGKVYTMGNNRLGQLGLGSETDLQIYSADQLPREVYLPSFRLVDPLAFDAPVLDLDCGTAHTVFVTEHGSLYSCGSDAKMQLGQFEVPPLPKRIASPKDMPRGFRHRPTLIPPQRAMGKFLHVTQVAAGGKHSLALGFLSSRIRPGSDTESSTTLLSATPDSEEELTFAVVSWGYGIDGQLGLYRPLHLAPPTRIGALTPVPRPEQPASQIIAISAGDDHSACLSSDGFIALWGANQEGQCGLARKKKRERLPRNLQPSEPRFLSAKIIANKGWAIQDIVCGPHATAVTAVGSAEN